MRAFAALVVILFHVSFYSSKFGQPFLLFQFLSTQGQCGVDIFFVVSGFVMVYTQENNHKSWDQFAIGRLTRIVPLYWTLTAAILLIQIAVPGGFSNDSDIGRAASSLFFVARLFSYVPLISVGWTLEYEMAFYAIFTLAIALARGKLVYALAAAAIAIMALHSPIVIEFAFGMICALLVLKNPSRPWLGAAAFALGVGLLLLSRYLVGPDHRVIGWGIPGFFIVYGACLMPQTRNGLAIWLGNASYSLYLIQALTIPSFYALARKAAQIPDSLLGIVCIGGTVVAGLIVHALIEKPLSKWAVALVGAGQRKDRAVA